VKGKGEGGEGGRVLGFHKTQKKIINIKATAWISIPFAVGWSPSSMPAAAPPSALRTVSLSRKVAGLDAAK
jgi:hypothetical protein